MSGPLSSEHRPVEHMSIAISSHRSRGEEAIEKVPGERKQKEQMLTASDDERWRVIPEGRGKEGGLHCANNNN